MQSLGLFDCKAHRASLFNIGRIHFSLFFGASSSRNRSSQFESSAMSLQRDIIFSLLLVVSERRNEIGVGCFAAFFFVFRESLSWLLGAGIELGFLLLVGIGRFWHDWLQQAKCRWSGGYASVSFMFSAWYWGGC